MSAKTEFDTLRVMINLFCKHKHASDNICSHCSELLEYAENRLLNCPLKSDKPTCQVCHIHCYSPDMQKRIVEVMKFSGPRMLLHHPVIALKHVLTTKKSKK